MSKSLGNVLDPRDVIAGATLQRRQFPHGLPECGADALRLALCALSGHGDSVRLDVQQLLAQRRFCTKVWNALRFIMGALGDTQGPQPPEEVSPEGPLERWLLGRLAQTVAEAERRMEALEPHGALGAAQQFWLSSFCGVYLVSGGPQG
ncbi:SYVM protein, partial [Nothoprocta ornata]|nr:SYVM protein [Nothoprocta ornata]